MKYCLNLPARLLGVSPRGLLEFSVSGVAKIFLLVVLEYAGVTLLVDGNNPIGVFGRVLSSLPRCCLRALSFSLRFC